MTKLKQLAPDRGTLRGMKETSTLRVACLCAEWCGVCRDYAALFELSSNEFDGRCNFTWIDIEDEADLIDGVDVENFPTLLIVRGDEVLFYGAITPHAQTLSRLVQGALAGDLKPLARTPEIDSLVRRISDRKY
jgi:thioredoxin 1